MTADQIELLTQQVQQLGPADQKEVFDFVAFLKTRSRPVGTPGHTLGRFSGSFPNEDVQEMMKAIDEGCGKVDEEGWK